MCQENRYCLEFLFNKKEIEEIDLKDRISELLTSIKSETVNTLTFNIVAYDYKSLKLSIEGTLADVDSAHIKITKKLLSEFVFTRIRDDVGNKLRQEAYPILSEIEQLFRQFIDRILIEVYGFNWAENLDIPKTQRDKLAKDKDKSSGKRSKNQKLISTSIESTTFEGLLEIIEKEHREWDKNHSVSVEDLLHLVSNVNSMGGFKDNLNEKVKVRSLKEVFSKYFQNAEALENLIKSIRCVINLRNAVMHHRPITRAELNFLVSQQKEIISILNLAKKSIDDKEADKLQKELDIDKFLPLSSTLIDQWREAKENKRFLNQNLTNSELTKFLRMFYQDRPLTEKSLWGFTQEWMRNNQNYSTSTDTDEINE